MTFRESTAAPQAVTRREFLARTGHGLAVAGGGAVLAGCRGRQPAPESPEGGRASHSFRLGLDTYSLHRTLSAGDPENRRDLLWVLEHLDALGLEGLQIDPGHFPGEDEETLARLEAVTQKHGYYLEFGMGGWDVTRLATRIRLTARFGGRAVRTFCGDQNTSPEDRRRYMELAAPAFRHAGGVADANAVDIAVENHGDFTSLELEELIQKVDHPRVGVCLDTGNSLFRDEAPLECARRLAPYARSMHLKDWTMVKDPEGKAIWREAVPGKGQVPVRRILELVAARQPDLYIALETPVAPAGDERETVAREWEHVQKSARAARQILEQL